MLARSVFPDRVLLKAGALSDEEFDIIKQHPEIGYRIVEQLGKLHFHSALAFCITMSVGMVAVILKV